MIFIINLLNWGNPEMTGPSSNADNSAESNLIRLEQIEALICKKTGTKFENTENSFVLNGNKVLTEVIIRKYGPSVYEEMFYDIDNPDNVCRIRLVKNVNGDRELAVLVSIKDLTVNYHAAFDSRGNMLEEDPWGVKEGYTIKTLDLYNHYRSLFSQRVDATNISKH